MPHLADPGLIQDEKLYTVKQSNIKICPAKPTLVKIMPAKSGQAPAIGFCIHNTVVPLCGNIGDTGDARQMSYIMITFDVIFIRKRAMD